MAKLDLGIVVIGRNEGERLRACLTSVVAELTSIVYVDSGSTDRSVELAKSMGVRVINLDMSVPFTAARARNEGWRALLEYDPYLTFIQFIDGDCELSSNWLRDGHEFLDSQPEFAAVCGRLIEKYPERSIYNRLCQHEWDAPSGEVKACGGIAMFRALALAASDGFRSDLIAGEEPELCYRLRQAGWKVMRLPLNMAYHDAAIIKFSQWWRRSKRAGYAFAEGAWLHGRSAERYWVKETLRAVVYGFLIPASIVISFFFNWFVALICLFVYPVQWVRLVSRRQFVRDVMIDSLFQVVGKFPEFFGVAQFYWSLVRGSRVQIIEYK